MRLDFGFFCEAGRKTTLEATLEPTIDSVQGGKTGAVLGLEVRVQVTRAFVAGCRRSSVMLARRRSA